MVKVNKAHVSYAHIAPRVVHLRELALFVAQQHAVPLARVPIGGQLPVLGGFELGEIEEMDAIGAVHESDCGGSQRPHQQKGEGVECHRPRVLPRPKQRTQGEIKS